MDAPLRIRALGIPLAGVVHAVAGESARDDLGLPVVEGGNVLPQVDPLSARADLDDRADGLIGVVAGWHRRRPWVSSRSRLLPPFFATGAGFHAVGREPKLVSRLFYASAFIPEGPGLQPEIFAQPGIADLGGGFLSLLRCRGIHGR